jgi:hypothetical protein
MDDTRALIDRWLRLVRNLVEGRDVILAGGVLAGFTPVVERLRTLGARRYLCIVNGPGTGPLPKGDDVEVVVVPFDVPTVTDEFRQWERVMAAPPDFVHEALASLDPHGDALLFINVFQAIQSLGDRRGFGARRPEWIALEDKTICDALFDRAGVARPESAVVPTEYDALVSAGSTFDRGDGTVWAGDASRGFNGGGEYVRRVRDEHDARDAAAFFVAECDRVRIAPFVEGVPASIHGFVTADGVAVFRPVELVTLRPAVGNRFRYAGAATYWDPAPADREAMRAAARRVGECLRAEVDFRGMFTVDGILGADGWVPTECNPRAGAALGYASVACPDVHLDLLHRLVIEGDEHVRAADLELALIPAADATRWGGGWTTVSTPWKTTQSLALERADGSYRIVCDGEEHDATIVCGPSATGGFVRCTFEPARTPVGASVAPLVVDGFAFADRVLDAGIGPLSPARPVR